MATLPLFQPNPIADAWHNVTAPGGYEWWYFDAEDPATDTQIVAIFFEGFVFHPGYLRAYQRYVNQPTRTLPPLPAEYPCAYFVVYRGGKILHQFMTQYPRDQFTAARDRVEVTVGPNQLREAAGALQVHLEGVPWTLTWQGPRAQLEQTLSADLTFKPRFAHPPDERRFLSRAMTAADHHWVLANPCCDVTGTITLNRGPGSEPQAISFNGRGYHDHNYGTGPIGPGLRRWIWGRVLTDEQVLTFHYAMPREASLAPELHLVRATGSSHEQLDDVSVTARWSRRSSTGLAYPSEMQFGDVLALRSPRVIDAAPFYMRVQYDALIGSQSVAKAFCEVAYPHRLRWPVLGRMIEMSIDKRSLAKATGAGVAQAPRECEPEAPV